MWFDEGQSQAVHERQIRKQTFAVSTEDKPMLDLISAYNQQISSRQPLRNLVHFVSGSKCEFDEAKNAGGPCRTVDL